jgi:hypothetical protein
MWCIQLLLSLLQGRLPVAGLPIVRGTSHRVALRAEEALWDNCFIVKDCSWWRGCLGGGGVDPAKEDEQASVLLTEVLEEGCARGSVRVW